MLIVISHTGCFPGESSVITRLFEEGLTCFHMRKPGSDEQQVRTLLKAIPAAWHTRIALHGFHYLAGEYGIQRLHYTEQQRNATDITEWECLKEAGYLLSTSVHRVDVLATLPPVFSYAFFGPVFNSITKQGYNSIIENNFCLATAQKAVPVIALGGITAENIPAVAAMQFDGAALLGALWQKPEDAVEVFKLINKQYEACHGFVCHAERTVARL